MILTKKNNDIDNSFTVSLRGNAEEIACEYVAITLKLRDEYPAILDRAQFYMEHIIEEERGND